MTAYRKTERKMTKEEKAILDWNLKETERIISEAKANGTWQRGLDANNHLFTDLREETFRKLKSIKK